MLVLHRPTVTVTLCDQALLQLRRRPGRDFHLLNLKYFTVYGCVVPRLGEAWIPLFASAGNFVWTVYLSGVSARPLPAPG